MAAETCRARTMVRMRTFMYPRSLRACKGLNLEIDGRYAGTRQVENLQAACRDDKPQAAAGLSKGPASICGVWYRTTGLPARLPASIPLLEDGL